ncbi:hypothetical protein PR048_033628 [Dryococelus australis]|uniref:Uncharacterized protein n=1 Tax=Dryococelus australis TaxID=614101 RepID=A0ABQ9G0U5_9NEOP|nr:hypothetical protein PR048_033628 [Dryococelus australis]
MTNLLEVECTEDCRGGGGLWAALNIEVLRNAKRSENGAVPEWKGGEVGDPRENSPTSGIVRHDSHLRKSGSEPAGDSTRFALVRGEQPNRSATVGSFSEELKNVLHGTIVGMSAVVSHVHSGCIATCHLSVDYLLYRISAQRQAGPRARDYSIAIQGSSSVEIHARSPFDTLVERAKSVLSPFDALDGVVLLVPTFFGLKREEKFQVCGDINSEVLSVVEGDEVKLGQRRNARVVVEKRGDQRENPPTSNIDRHDSHVRKSMERRRRGSIPVRLCERRAGEHRGPIVRVSILGASYLCVTFYRFNVLLTCKGSLDYAFTHLSTQQKQNYKSVFLGFLR